MILIYILSGLLLAVLSAAAWIVWDITRLKCPRCYHGVKKLPTSHTSLHYVFCKRCRRVVEQER